MVLVAFLLFFILNKVGWCSSHSLPASSLVSVRLQFKILTRSLFRTSERELPLGICHLCYINIDGPKRNERAAGWDGRPRGAHPKNKSRTHHRHKHALRSRCTNRTEPNRFVLFPNRSRTEAAAAGSFFFFSCQGSKVTD